MKKETKKMFEKFALRPIDFLGLFIFGFAFLIGCFSEKMMMSYLAFIFISAMFLCGLNMMKQFKLVDK